MPAKSQKQQKLFGIALAIKRGELPKSYSKIALKLAKTLSEKKLREFAKTKRKRLPVKVKKTKKVKRRKR